MESDEYWKQKRIYEQGLRDYVAKRGSKYEEALVSSTKTINSAAENVAGISSSTARSLSVLIAVSFIIALLFSYLISSSVSKPIAKLEEAIFQVAKGNIDFRVEIGTKDEFKVLADAFNSMADQLKSLKKVEKKQKMLKELEALEVSHAIGFISEESYKKERGRLEESVIRLGGSVDAELLKEKGFITRGSDSK